MTTQDKQQHVSIRQALGSEWSSLGTSIQRNYDLPPHTDIQLEVDGIMEVVLSPMGKLFITVGRFFDALAPYKGREISVKARNWSKPDGTAMSWHRTFRYPGKDPVVFLSHMEYAGDNDTVEYVKYGLGIRMRLSAEGEILRYDSQGCQWNLGPLTLRIPDWLLLGKAVIQEIPLSEQAFQVSFEIHHPLWGRTFGYWGQFTFSE